DHQVHEADAEYAGNRGQCQLPRHPMVEADQGSRKIGGREGDVANIDWEADQLAESTDGPEQDAEIEITHQAAQVVLDIMRQTQQALLAQYAAQSAQLRHPPRHAGV